MSMLLKVRSTEGEPRGNSASLQGRSPGWDWEISDNWNLKGVSSWKTSWGDGSCNSYLSSLGHLTDRPSCIGEEPTWAHSVLQDLLKSLDLSHQICPTWKNFREPPGVAERHIWHSPPGSFPHIFRWTLNHISIILSFGRWSRDTLLGYRAEVLAQECTKMGWTSFVTKRLWSWLIFHHLEMITQSSSQHRA